MSYRDNTFKTVNIIGLKHLTFVGVLYIIIYMMLLIVDHVLND